MELENREQKAKGRREDACAVGGPRSLGREEELVSAVPGALAPERSKLEGTLETLRSVLICLVMSIT